MATRRSNARSVPADLHATILHALGIDQYKLFYEHHGRKELVTVLGGDVVSEAFS